MLTHHNKALTMGQRRSLSIAVQTCATAKDGSVVWLPEHLDRLCELTIKVAQVDVGELEALPVEEQVWELHALATRLSKGLSGEASGA